MPSPRRPSPTCDNYFGKVFAHLGGAIAIAAASAEYVNLNDQLFQGQSILIQKIVSFIILIALLFGTMSAAPGGVLKYALFGGFAFWLGQSLHTLVKRLKDKQAIARVLTLTTGVFLGMMALGFYDRQNLLGFGPYLFAGLAGLILVELLILAFGTPEERKTGLNYTRLFGIGLFAVLTAYDVQVVKAGATACKALKKRGVPPDYPVESLGLFLDFANLFAKFGGGED